MGSRWQWYYNKTQHTKIQISHKITHQGQIKHSTRSNTNNKVNITHNEYNTNSTAFHVTGRGGLRGCEISRIANCLDNLIGNYVNVLRDIKGGKKNSENKQRDN
jgi:hypothetical protein